MDDGGRDFSNQGEFSGLNFDDPPSDFLDEILNDTDTHGCTHTHTCNPPGPNFPHTHTCFHVHTKIVSASTENKVSTDDTPGPSENKSKKCSLGNREATRKYREKKKAHAASLEGKLASMMAQNQHLLQRLKSQAAAFEAENARLKWLLVHIRGSIEGAIGSFPNQNPAESAKMYQNLGYPNLPGSYMMNQCDMECAHPVHCLQQGEEGKSGEDMLLNVQGLNSCAFENLPCLGNQNDGLKEISNCGLGNITSAVNPSHPN